jgi:catechol 2,3-dioxygenase-like lactoylglutathione lyase family enzyme
MRLINLAQGAAMSVVLNQIAQIAINVHDLPRAVAFYRDVLGMRHLFDAGSRLSFFNCGGIRLMLSLPEKPEFDHRASILYYKVADLQPTYEALAAKGVKFEQKPGAGCADARPRPVDGILARFRKQSAGADGGSAESKVNRKHSAGPSSGAAANLIRFRLQVEFFVATLL